MSVANEMPCARVSVVSLRSVLVRRSNPDGYYRVYVYIGPAREWNVSKNGGAATSQGRWLECYNDHKNNNNNDNNSVVVHSHD